MNPNNGYVSNRLHKLEESYLTNEQILTVSIYVGKDPSLRELLSFGNHERACFYEGAPDYQDMVIRELSGVNTTKTPPLQINQGEMLLLSETALQHSFDAYKVK
jgi:hypothetical protein